MENKKIYKSTYYIFVKVVFFFTFIAIFISPVIGKRQFDIKRTLIIMIIFLFYLFTKKRISKIAIDETNEVIELQVSHFLFLRQNNYSYCVQDVKIKEFEKYFSGRTLDKFFDISISNNTNFEINTLTDGWSLKTLKKVKEDVEKLQNKINKETL